MAKYTEIDHTASTSASLSADEERILRYHREGLDRFSTVIDGNRQYDLLLAHRLSEEELAEFPIGLDIDLARSRAYEKAASILRTRRHKIRRLSFEGFVCEGKTRNNLKEFEFFERITAPLGINLLSNNYDEAERVATKRSIDSLEPIIERMLLDVEDYYSLRSQITPSIVSQQILYSRSFLNFLVAFLDERSVVPKAVVLANDHSPTRVSLSMVMKGLGVPRIYLQHAEVSDCFPPLDFEYSVLRNQRSLAVYKRIGPISGRTFVIGRDSIEPDTTLLSRSPGNTVEVVIYPTSRIVSDALLEMVQNLKCNSAVTSIGLKQHPGAARPLEELLAGTGVKLMTEFPSTSHIAIVGNSSVALELIAQGTPVYQNFEFDPVDSDYYGFVRDGITHVATLESLKTKFWTPYQADQAWRAALSKWLPDFAESKANTALFLSEMASLSGVNLAQAEPVPPAAPNSVDRHADEKLAQNLIQNKDGFGPPSPQERSVKSWLKRFIRRRLAANPTLARWGVKMLFGAGSRLSRYAKVADRSISIDTGSEETLPSDTVRHRERDTTRDKLRDRKRDKRRDEERDRQRDAERDGARDTPRDLARDARRDLTHDSPLLTLALREARDPLAFFVKAQSLEGANPLPMIRALETAIRERDAGLVKFFEKYTRPDWNSAAGVYAFLRRSEWINDEISVPDLNKALEFFDNLDDKEPIKKVMINALFPALINYGTERNIGRFFDPESLISWDRLTFSRRLVLIKKLSNTPGRAADAQRLLNELRESASPLGALKVRNFEHLMGWLKTPWSHEDAEGEFLAVAPAHISRDFRSYASPVYETLRSRMRFMELRSEAAQQLSLEKKIGEAITSRKPFSCLRLSDREGYLFSREGLFTDDDVRNCELHWWGVELAGELRDRIVEEARTAVGGADIVGIPSVFRFIRDAAEKSGPLVGTLQGRGLLDVLSGIGKLSRVDAEFTEDKFNVGFLGDLERVTRLAAAARRLVVVSSVAQIHLPAQLTGHHDFQHISLPSHQKTRANRKYARGKTILPLAYPEIADRLTDLAGGGTLVLVAGGLIGKILLERARAAGSVVLDVGHVVDDWATSRSAPIR